MHDDETWIEMADGVRLAVSLVLPDGDGPWPSILEALPYRKDDLTVSYRGEYCRLADEGGFAVARVDVRGTGSSEGIATDEYPPEEQTDLAEVIAWLASQPWSNGNVGMYGTSYSGFNSLQLAARRPPALKAVCAIYATDDCFTDDVHYVGGSLRALDLVDYPTYMIAANALPPVPAVYGDGWREEWRRRVDGTEPWVLRWLTEQVDSPYWRKGSLRAGHPSPGVRRGLRPHRGRHHARRRLGRRLPQQHLPHLRTPDLPQAPAGRSVEPHVHRVLAARPRTSISYPS